MRPPGTIRQVGVGIVLCQIVFSAIVSPSAATAAVRNSNPVALAISPAFGSPVPALALQRRIRRPPRLPSGPRGGGFPGLPVHVVTGIEALTLAGSAFVRTPTDDVSKMVVHLGSVDGHLVVQTNNRIVNGGDEITTFVAGQGVGEISLEEIVKDLLHDPTRESDFAFLLRYFTHDASKVENDLTVFIDQNYFLDRKAPPLRFDIRKVRVTDGTERSWPLKAMEMDGRIIPFLELGPHIYSRAEKVGTARFLDELASYSFDPADVGVLSLVSDTRTNDAINRLFPHNGVPFRRGGREGLIAGLQHQRNRSVFVVGHVEGNDFVTRGARNQELFRIGIAELKALALECCGVEVFPLGCNTGFFGLSGILNRFNTVDAVERLAQATASTNYRALLEQLAGPDLMMVVDHTVLGGAKYREIVLYRRRQVAGQVVIGSQVGRLILPITPRSKGDGWETLFGIAVIAGVSFVVIRGIFRFVNG